MDTDTVPSMASWRNKLRRASEGPEIPSHRSWYQPRRKVCDELKMMGDEWEVISDSIVGELHMVIYSMW